MRLCDVEFLLTKLDPLSQGIADRLVLVRVQTDAAVDGWGEAPVPWRVGELARRREQLLPTLAGRNILDLAELAELNVLSPPLRAAVEIACWDAAGKALGQPVARFWGGFYRHQVPVGQFVGDMDEDEILTQAQRMYDRGVTCWILGTSGQIAQDLEVLRAIRDQFGEAIQLRVDARRRFDFTAAVHLCLQMESLGIHCLIDPLATNYWQTYRRLQQESPVPIAIRRGLKSLRDVWAVCQCGAARHLILDMYELGGPLAIRNASAVAQAAQVEVSLGMPASVGIGLAAALHLGAALPPLVHAHNLWQYCEDSRIVHPFAVKNGMWTVPEEPGLGIPLQRDHWELLTLARDF
jgi:L-alanine-DL-glutamate epimerase-like enolase superfamily enzyme